MESFIVKSFVVVSFVVELLVVVELALAIWCVAYVVLALRRTMVLALCWQ